MMKKVFIGLCLFILLFNFLFNLVVYKVVLVIVVGCIFVFKLVLCIFIGVFIIGEVLVEIDLLKGVFFILLCSCDGVDLFIIDECLKLFSFIGFLDVGWVFKVKVGKKLVVLELGGNVVCVVDEDVDIEDVIECVIVGVYY